MERYCRHVVYRAWVGPGRPDAWPRPHASFDTLRQAAHYVGFADLDDQGAYAYSVIDLEHPHLGDMLVAEEGRAIVAAGRAEGEREWRAAA